MDTRLLYIDNWTVYNATAKVVALTEREGQLALVLDQTIFYPQGGGQPADHGEIIGESGAFQVAGVRSVDGIVYHFGEFVQGNFQVGDTVELLVNQERREMLNKLHSAGHLLDVAMAETGCNFVYGKGYHFPDHPYVEYEATLTPDECIGLQKELQVAVDELIARDIPITGRLVDKSISVVSIGDLASCPCGGTHVPSTAVIGRIKIIKIKSKGGVLRVSYQL